MVYLIDGVEVARKVIGGGEWLDIADRDGPAGKKVILQMASTSAKITAGKHEVTLTYITRSNALGNAAQDTGRPSMPGLATAIEIEGPFQPSGRSMNDSRAKVFVCQPKTDAEQRPCAERIARDFATRAFRRPVTDADLAPLMKFYDSGRKEAGGFESEPYCRARIFSIAPSRSRQSRMNRACLRIRNWPRACRSSCGGWGPDKELIDLAANRKLSAPGVMDAQVARMLKDPRANSLVESFALSWLKLNDLETVDVTGFAAMRKN